MSYIQDPNNSKKQVAKGITYPSTSHIPVFDTDAAAQVAKPAPGTMTYSKEQADGRIYIYDGSAWGYIDLTA
jgi:hypothetical protein